MWGCSSLPTSEASTMKPVLAMVSSPSSKTLGSSTLIATSMSRKGSKAWKTWLVAPLPSLRLIANLPSRSGKVTSGVSMRPILAGGPSGVMGVLNYAGIARPTPPRRDNAALRRQAAEQDVDQVFARGRLDPVLAEDGGEGRV